MFVEHPLNRTKRGANLRQYLSYLQATVLGPATAHVDMNDALYSISLEGRDAPMRTVTFFDRSELGAGLLLRFTTYRTLVTVEIVKAP